MAAKVNFNEITKIITVTLAPDVNGEIYIDVKTDLYSDGKEDWVINENLRKFVFPVRSAGGDDLPGSKALGATFFLASDWKIRPYEASHKLIINGNLYSEDGTDPFLDTVGTYTVRIIQQVSSLVTSIDVITAADISQAVWAKDITSITTSGTAGKTLYDIGSQGVSVDNDAIAYAVLNEQLDGYTVSGSFGYVVNEVNEDLKRALGLLDENSYFDQQVYNVNDRLLSGRKRIYSDKASVGTDNDVIATYTITCTWSGNQLTSYKVIKV